MREFAGETYDGICDIQNDMMAKHADDFLHVASKSWDFDDYFTKIESGWEYDPDELESAVMGWLAENM